MAAIANDLHNKMAHNEWSPYEDNGGTVAAIAGEDFAVLAADTRQSVGYSINARYAPKAFKLTDTTVIGASGFHADIVNLVKKIQAQLQMYRYKHDKEESIKAIAQSLQITLYKKRFFPFYAFNILAGLDEEGKGAVYSFDPVGSYEREGYRAGGSAGSLVQPFLDSQVGLKNQLKPNETPLTVDRAVKLLRDAFNGATERDIYTGDFLEVFIITKAGVEVQRYDLKKD